MAALHLLLAAQERRDTQLLRSFSYKNNPLAIYSLQCEVENYLDEVSGRQQVWQTAGVWGVGGGEASEQRLRNEPSPWGPKSKEQCKKINLKSVV